MRSSPETRSSSSPTSSARSAGGGRSCSPRVLPGRNACSPASSPTSSTETREVREGDWQVAQAPPDLQDRRVEITGPTDRKMVINALNSGAQVFMADFEDANSPTWANMVEGQVNLIDAIERTIALDTGRAELPAERRDGDAARAAARLAPGREARPGRRRADLGQPVRLRPVLLPQRQASCSRAAAGRTSTCRSWRATSRRACGTTSSCARRTRSASRTARSRRPC